MMKFSFLMTEIMYSSVKYTLVLVHDDVVRSYHLVKDVAGKNFNCILCVDPEIYTGLNPFVSLLFTWIILRGKLC